MKRIKIFKCDGYRIDSIQRDINTFISNNDIEVDDIKVTSAAGIYTTSSFGNADTLFYTIIYHDVENKNKFEAVSDNEINNTGVLDPVIILPKRATSKSAGYDFYVPYDLTIKPNETVKIPTFIKASMNDNTALQIFPRSSLGFKYKLQLDNTVGIIDADYYNNPNNEGHIFVKVTNWGDKPVVLKAGDAFCQGIFITYGKTVNDNTTAERVGGFGSTN